ncbi:MAG TPA: hypothetical protein VJO16_15345 [Candidatus Acidoferrum sp.]|nr:hypothetical protein [Candidatus Acidoferrum sp.]
MATPAREYSLEYYLLEHMKYGGIDRENLADLVSIVVSLKNKYGIAPFASLPHGAPVPVGLTLRYQVEATTLPKLINIIHDTPRLNSLTVVPRGIPAAATFEVRITLGG